MPLLPRVARKPDRLQLLREQAFSRLLVEEARVTRRRAMMLVAGAAAVGLRGKALAAPGPRSTAPQYGAPGDLREPAGCEAGQLRGQERAGLAGRVEGWPGPRC